MAVDQEAQIAAALNEAGRVATLLSLKKHDTEGSQGEKDSFASWVNLYQRTMEAILEPIC